MNICKDKCLKLKSIKTTKKGMYSNGERYCCECQAFFKTEMTFCICCGMRMRTKGRNLNRSEREDIK